MATLQCNSVCARCKIQTIALCTMCLKQYESSELTRLRAELDEARRHAKVLADACLMYHVDQLQYDQALDYAEELP